MAIDSSGAVYPSTHSQMERLEKQIEELQDRHSDLGQVAREAYYSELAPDAIPGHWTQQAPILRKAWRAAAAAVIAHQSRRWI